MLNLIIAPDPVFSKKAEPVTQFDVQLHAEIDEMFRIMSESSAIGLGANMVGLLKQIVVVDLKDGIHAPLTLINPRIILSSDRFISMNEASVSFPGIEAEIERPEAIEVAYQDKSGQPHTLKADGMLARVILHEMDYLEGQTFLDHLSKFKKNRLMKKLRKVSAS